MKIFVTCCLLTLINTCSSGKFESSMTKQQNLNEIKEFKEHLKLINFMDDFKEDATIRNFTDARVKEFVKKYRINSIQVWTCKPYPYAYDHFTECGNMLILSNVNVPLVQDNHSIIFDYSEDGLEMKEGTSTKHKISERIFVF